MTKILLLFLLGLFLSACTPAPYPDPVTLREAANGMIAATMTAEVSQAKALAMDAERLQQEAQATSQSLEAAGAATRQALEMLAVQSTMARDVSDYATAQAATAVALDATATAIIASAGQEQYRAEIGGYVDVGWLFLPLCSAVVVVAWFLMFLYKGGDYVLESYIRDRSVMERRAGTVAWVEDQETGMMMPVLLAGNLRPQTPKITVNTRGSGEPKQLTASVLEYPPSQPNGVREQALDLLWQAAEINGQASDTIPGWRDVKGFSSDKWKRVVAALKETGYVETSPSGTKVKNTTVFDLHFLIDMGTVKVRPVREQ